MRIIHTLVEAKPRIAKTSKAKQLGGFTTTHFAMDTHGNGITMCHVRFEYNEYCHIHKIDVILLISSKVHCFR